MHATQLPSLTHRQREKQLKLLIVRMYDNHEHVSIYLLYRTHIGCPNKHTSCHIYWEFQIEGVNFINLNYFRCSQKRRRRTSLYSICRRQSYIMIVLSSILVNNCLCSTISCGRVHVKGMIEDVHYKLNKRISRYDSAMGARCEIL